MTATFLIVLLLCFMGSAIVAVSSAATSTTTGVTDDSALTISTTRTASASAAVEVLVCTEALCPGCHEFVEETLIPVYKELGSEVIDLKLVPYGNARPREDDNQVECQHGPGECDANVWELCSIYTITHPKDYLPFIHCLDKSLPMGHADEPFDRSIFESCAKINLLDFQKLADCHDDPQVANKLVDAAAANTPEDHEYVPWIVVGGQHLNADEQDFKTEVCKQFVANGGSHEGCISGNKNKNGLRLTLSEVAEGVGAKCERQ